jgi:integrase
MKFTQANVIRIKPPSGKADHWEPDEATPGFGIRFRNNGPGVFGVRYSIGGRDRRLSLDRVSRITLADARAWARKQFLAVAEKTDPAVARAQALRKTANTIEPLIDNFLGYLAAKGRAPSYIVENTRSLRKYFKALHRFGPDDISRTMVAEELRKIRNENGPIAADRSRAHLSKFFGWCIGEGLAENNPVSGTNRTGNKPRERLLSDAEVKAIWHVLGDGDYADICRLLILTGCRKSEIASLSWSEFKDGQLELPGSRTKNGRDHIVPLSPMALAILTARKPRPGSDFVFGRSKGAGFSGWSRPKVALDKTLGIEPWVPHDFRRTISTVMHERLKVPPHIVEAVLNHVSGARAGVAGRYNRAEYADDKRIALNAYADHVARIVGDV